MQTLILNISKLLGYYVLFDPIFIPGQQADLSP
jgi:hypothetical protein